MTSLFPFLFFLPLRFPAWMVLGFWFVLQWLAAQTAARRARGRLPRPRGRLRLRLPLRVGPLPAHGVRWSVVSHGPPKETSSRDHRDRAHQDQRRPDPEIAESIAALDSVSEVYSVTGTYDLIALVRVARHDDLADIIPGRISKIPGVEATDTHVAFRTYSQHDLEAAFAIGLDA